MGMSNKIDKEFLISVGFREVYDYRNKTREKIENILVWGNLLDYGESVDIKLSFDEGNWKVVKIKFTGELAERLINENFSNYDLNEVVSFVEKYPFTTF